MLHLPASQGTVCAHKEDMCLQNLAQHYHRGLHFLKLYGNSNDDCKHLFKDRLLTRVTPTWFFFKNGMVACQAMALIP